ncbi:MAG: anion transporter, partial [Methanobacteriota archaeon]
NPQNLLIASSGGMANPFVVFGSYLVLPTVVCLVAAWLVLRVLYRDAFSSEEFVYEPMPACERNYAILVQCSLAIILLLIAVNVASSVLTGGITISLALIALFAALPLLLFSKRRVTLLKNIDWCTLVFFAAMFVLMASVWQTGFFQSFVTAGFTTDVPAILPTSVIISQFISNVPFVALFQPIILQAGGGLPQLMALAAGSTIAGNLTIIGAASNVIIIQQAEKRGETLTFVEFFRAGAPLTIIQILIYWIFLG